MFFVYFALQQTTAIWPNGLAGPNDLIDWLVFVELGS